MTSTSLLVLLFIILPGFVADSIARASFGDKKLTDFERTVRSLIYSVAGLFVYMMLAWLVNGIVWRVSCHERWLFVDAVRPSYLAAVSDPQGKTKFQLNGLTALVLLLHSGATVGTAVLWSWVTSRDFVLKHFSEITGRALGGTAWILFWTRFFPVPKEYKEKVQGPRWVTVQLTGGRRIMGQFQAATDTPDEESDLVLGHPWFWDAVREDWHAENVRYIFIPANQIEYVLLPPVGDQIASTGYKTDLEH